jgi:hypothetical protein
MQRQSVGRAAAAIVYAYDHGIVTPRYPPER